MNNVLIQSSIYLSNIFSPEFLFLSCIILFFLSILYLKIKNIKYKEIFSVRCPNNIKGLIIIFLSIIISTISIQLIKFIFKIPRPVNMLVEESGYSFPSGHTSTVFAVCFVGMYLIFKYINTRNYLYSFLLIIPAILVASSRLVLQVHRPVDILFGFIVGVISAFLSIKIYYNIIKYADQKNNQ